MSRTFVKLCGLQTPEDAEKLNGVDADAAGMIFVPGRRRTVKGKQAAAIAAQLPRGIEKVGVFMDPAEEDLREVTNRIPLDWVQLHGTESPRLCRWVKEELGTAVIKVVHAGQAPLAPAEAYADHVDAVLVDSVLGKQKGGTGQVFSWDLLRTEQAHWRALGLPVWVAGGLTADNVEGLLTEHAPDGVDTSSGVESEGVKDRSKMRRFVERVRKYDRQHR